MAGGAPYGSPLPLLCQRFLVAFMARQVYDGPMEKTSKKRGIAAIWRLCPTRHILLLLGCLLIGGHLATRNHYSLNRSLSEGLVRPLHRLLSRGADLFPFSVAEALIALAVFVVLGYLIVQLVLMFRRKEWGKRLFTALVTLLAVGALVYGGFCLLWGVYYYGDDFIARSGLPKEKISSEQLAEVTAWYAALANEYAGQVPRDTEGVCSMDRKAILERSPEIYQGLERRFPCLEGPAVHAKGIACSRIMSLIDFTGFFFPFTAEANVNMDFPTSLLPSTVAHEQAHQRGVAKEQEANFVAVLACLDYGDPEYVYSAALLAYTHLGNALYEADYDAWEDIYLSLNESVKRDFAANRLYWKQFETPVQKASNTVYEGFLHSYDQDLGLKSYGACVDLLVNYFFAANQASQAIGS